MPAAVEAEVIEDWLESNESERDADAQPFTPDYDSDVPGDDLGRWHRPGRHRPRAAMMSFEDAVSAQAAMRRDITQRRALPRGRS